MAPPACELSSAPWVVIGELHLEDAGEVVATALLEDADHCGRRFECVFLEWDHTVTFDPCDDRDSCYQINRTAWAQLVSLSFARAIGSSGAKVFGVDVPRAENRRLFREWRAARGTPAEPAARYAAIEARTEFMASTAVETGCTSGLFVVGLHHAGPAGGFGVGTWLGASGRDANTVLARCDDTIVESGLILDAPEVWYDLARLWPSGQVGGTARVRCWEWHPSAGRPAGPSPDERGAPAPDDDQGREVREPRAR